MLLTEKFDSPVIKLLRSDNLEFILSFFYTAFRGKEYQTDSIKEEKLEKDLQEFILFFNKKSEFVDKKEENAKNYIEFWIKNQFLRRIEVGDMGEYNIELTPYTLQVMNFFDNLGIEEKYLHASVKSDFESALSSLKFIAFSESSFKEQNLKEIDKQIKELEKKKKLIETGDLKAFEEEVYDKYISAKEILKKMPANFRKVETVFENIYSQVQKKSNEIDINRGKILSFTLDEIEQNITNSPQGKSFDGFEDFYSKKPKELILALEKVFLNYEHIVGLEKEKSIKSLIEVDLLKAKKRAYNKKTFIVSKLRDVFNEDSRLDRKIAIDLIKNIKNFTLDNTKNINFKNNILEINNGFGIDIFMGKNFFEGKKVLKFQTFNISNDKEVEEISIENIFKFSSISELEIKKRILEFLKEHKEVKLKQILQKYPIQYGLDEYLNYMKLATVGELGQIKDFNQEQLEILGVYNKLNIKSGEIQFNNK